MLQLNRDFGNKKLEQIVKTSLKLFWHYGLKRITVEEICQEAAVSKNTFYKHFNNKIDLIRLIMNSLYEQGMNDFENIMSMPVPFEEKLEKMMDLKLKAAEDMSANFFRDMYMSGDEEIVKMLQEMVKEREKMVYAAFKLAQEQGEIRKDLKLEFVIFLMGKMTSFIEDETLLNMFDSPTELIVELTRFSIYGMLPMSYNAKNNE